MYEWQQNNPDAVAKSKEATSTPRNTQPQKKRKKNQTLSRKSVSKIVAKEVAKAVGKPGEQKKEEDLRKYLTSMVEVAVKNSTAGPSQSASAATIEAAPQQPTNLLRSILKRSRNNNA